MSDTLSLEIICCPKCRKYYNFHVWTECPMCSGALRHPYVPQSTEVTKLVKEAGAIVIREGRVLLTRSNKKPHLWWFPKGHVEATQVLSEQPEECAVRETEEETGVICYVQKKIGDAFYNREGADYEVQYYLCHYVGEIKPKETGRTILWCPLELAFPILTAPNLKDLLLQAIQEYE